MAADLAYKFVDLTSKKYGIMGANKLFEKCREILDNVFNHMPICFYGLPTADLESATCVSDPDFDFINTESANVMYDIITIDFIKHYLHSREDYARRQPPPIQRRYRWTTCVDRYAKWQADLIDLSFLEHTHTNKSPFRYALTIIDIYSKYAFAALLTRKTSEQLAINLEHIFKSNIEIYVRGRSTKYDYYKLKPDILVSPFIPLMLLTDKGKEFENKKVKAVCQRFGVRQYFSKTGVPLGIIERFNGTLKRKMRDLLPQKAELYAEDIFNILHNAIYSYNTSIHSTTKERPALIHLLPTMPFMVFHKNKIDQRYRSLSQKEASSIRQTYSVGDIVRVLTIDDPRLTAPERRKLESERTFGKHKKPYWTKEQFNISEVIKTERGIPHYKLAGYHAHVFTAEQLQKVKQFHHKDRDSVFPM